MNSIGRFICEVTYRFERELGCCLCLRDELVGLPGQILEIEFLEEKQTVTKVYFIDLIGGLVFTNWVMDYESFVFLLFIFYFQCFYLNLNCF